MAEHRDGSGGNVPATPSTEKLIAQSSVGGETDPGLDWLCDDSDLSKLAAFTVAESVLSPAAETEEDADLDGTPTWQLAGDIGLGGSEPRPGVVAYACSSTFGTGWVSLTQRLLEPLERKVGRGERFDFYTRLDQARYFVRGDFPPVPSSSPILSRPVGQVAQPHRPRLYDDAAFVVDTARVRSYSRAQKVVPGHLNVYWPCQIKKENDEYFYWIPDATYRIDLSPHIHLSGLSLQPRGTTSPHTLALLWRVVNPSVALKAARRDWTGKLEAGVERSRPSLQSALTRYDDPPYAVLASVAADSYWQELGIRVCAQVCPRTAAGEVETGLTSLSYLFLTDAIQDLRRWFPAVGAEIAPKGADASSEPREPGVHPVHHSLPAQESAFADDHPTETFVKLDPMQLSARSVGQANRGRAEK